MSSSQHLRVNTAVNYQIPVVPSDPGIGPGALVFVLNTSGGNINVSPPTGGAFMGQAVDAAYVLRAGKTLVATHLKNQVFALREVA